MTQSYSMRKIPVVKKEQTEKLLLADTDKIKILEISNFIDFWEKELLFSEKGFYSLKGKEVENKTKEFIDNLSELVNLKIYEINFSSQSSKELVVDIKNKKIEAIRLQMQNYEQSQLKEWESEVYENSIKSCIQRAVLYKNNPEIIDLSLKNGLSVLKVMSEKENWSSRTIKARRQLYEADFYFELINAFIIDKDVKASTYFSKYKEKLRENDGKVLENAMILIEQNIIAYNWAKELLSYDLTDSENEKELKEIKDKELETVIRKYFLELKNSKKKLEFKQENEKNEENWKKIISILQTDLNSAELYIDYTLNKESINAKKLYIKNMRKNGYIQTDKSVFLNFINLMFEDFEKFKKEDISNSRKSLSTKDYEIIEKLRTFSDDEYNFFVSDYRYIQRKLGQKLNENNEEIYELLKLLFTAKNTYVSIKKEEPDIEKRNKIIDAVLERYIEK